MLIEMNIQTFNHFVYLFYTQRSTILTSFELQNFQKKLYDSHIEKLK